MKFLALTIYQKAIPVIYLQLKHYSTFQLVSTVTLARFGEVAPPLTYDDRADLWELTGTAWAPGLWLWPYRYVDLAVAYIYEITAQKCDESLVSRLHELHGAYYVMANSYKDEFARKLLASILAALVDLTLKLDAGITTQRVNQWLSYHGAADMCTWSIFRVQIYYLTYDFVVNELREFIHGRNTDVDFAKYVRSARKAYITQLNLPKSQVTDTECSWNSPFLGDATPARTEEILMFTQELEKEAREKGAGVAELFFAGHPGKRQEKIRDFNMMLNIKKIKNLKFKLY